MSRVHTAPSRSQLRSTLGRQTRAGQRELILQLQQSIGNAATARLLRDAGLPRGLGEGGDELPDQGATEGGNEAEEAASETAANEGEEATGGGGAGPEEQAAETGGATGAGPEEEGAANEEEEGRILFQRLFHKDEEQRPIEGLRRDPDTSTADSSSSGTLNQGGTATLTYPDIDKIKGASSVTTEIEADWTSSESDFNERAAWVMYDTSTKAFSVQGRATGTWESCQPTPKPADGGGKVHVGHYHIHPPLPPAQRKNTLNFPIGPSDQDTNFASSQNSPGFVKDFITSERKSGNTSYFNYGPSVRA